MRLNIDDTRRYVLFFVGLVPLHIIEKTRWSTDARTVAGGRGRGAAEKQLHLPFSLDNDDQESLFVADTDNHRIVRWKSRVTQGKISGGGKGRGSRTDQLERVRAVLIDRMNTFLLISEEKHRRVMQWSLKQRRRDDDEGETIISNFVSLGLATHDEGSLYVSDSKRNEVCRYEDRDAEEGSGGCWWQRYKSCPQSIDVSS